MNCYLCGSEHIYHYHTDHTGRKIYKCKNCKIQFLNPQYTNEYLADFYSRYVIEDPRWIEPFLNCHNFYLSLIEKYNVNKGLLLDIGCGGGYILTAAQNRGWQVEGYDVDCEFVKSLQKKLNIKIHCGDFTKIKWKKNYYDVITLHQVIEHLKNPVEYIEIISSSLKKSGILFIALPNINSLSCRLKFLQERIKIRKKKVGAYYSANHHLWYYTPKTLKYLLNKYNFKILMQKGGYKVRPFQSKMLRWIKRNVLLHFTFESTFFIIAGKTDSP